MVDRKTRRKLKCLGSIMEVSTPQGSLKLTALRMVFGMIKLFIALHNIMVWLK